MPFLPFYIPRSRRLKIVVIGGGYAGIAALVTLLRHMPEIDIVIIDPRFNHLKITHLHETFRYPLDDFLIPFSALENRFGCRHICAELNPSESVLRQWQNDKFLEVNNEILEFDYLLLASGSPVMQVSKPENVFDLLDFMTISGSDLFHEWLNRPGGIARSISVIGGGATGIQFLFEISHFLKRNQIECMLRLVHGENQVLNQFPIGFSTYTQSKMTDLGIEFFPDTRYLGQQGEQILLGDNLTGREFTLPSSISLLFVGKKLETPFSANAFGQVVVEGMTLPNIFTAGDCSVYRAVGSNTMTAQSAVRKGMLAARNILRHSGVLRLLEPYFHRDLGYVVSLGPTDAIGWLALEGNVVGGMPAMLIKELVEAQYDLLLTGLDTYLV
ncbi:MAG TPA: FAD-dependent oxidoreductase [Nitrosospira sp.]|nr:FAD-dependent oxidoreductase [Nitrosospira sp.]